MSDDGRAGSVGMTSVRSPETLYLPALPEPLHRRNYQSYGLRDDRRFGDKLKALRHWLETSYVNEVISRSRSNLIHRAGSDTRAS
ncbi:hypothetical protein ALC60_01578 [Trachymyrmex zeteki]|uniref:Uncharacterized protein n=1 Tax=Mycetomoellerius zeteki TaxID=64791 RepID=A0A151XG91_9HYME|nr:hypothetical protein ALC60_01578 [Trachymyrmex zeteki]